MANIDSAFQIEKLSLNDNILIVDMPIDPSAVGFDAPRGSLLFQTTSPDGRIFQKIGDINTDWIILGKITSQAMLVAVGTPTSNQMLGVTNDAASLEYKSLVSGTGITISYSNSDIIISSNASGGTVTSIDASGGTTGLSFIGGPITSSGTLTLAGTLVTGNGGTGLTSIGTADQILGVNAGATGLEYKTISAGTGISVTTSTNSITLDNTGVTSLVAGTGISLSGSTGSVTITNTSSGGGGGGSSMTIPIYGGGGAGTPYVQINNRTLTAIVRILFDGSAVMGTPTSVKVVAMCQATNSNGTVLIHDVTNNNTIATTGATINQTTTYGIANMGAVSNVDTNPAIWEIQTNTVNGWIQVSCVTIFF